MQDKGLAFFQGWKTMAPQQHIASLRRGQFLWLDKAAQQRYLHTLKRRIAEGYYNSDLVFSKVVEEIAPVLEEIVAGK